MVHKYAHPITPRRYLDRAKYGFASLPFHLSLRLVQMFHAMADIRESAYYLWKQDKSQKDFDLE